MASNLSDLPQQPAQQPITSERTVDPDNALGIPLRRVWGYVGLAFIALIVANVLLYGLLFIFPYLNLAGLALPYSEDFDGKSDADFVRLRGVWEILDNTLIQHNPTGSDLSIVIPLKIDANQPYQYQAQLRLIDGQMGGGLLFNMQKRNRHQSSQVVRLTPAENGEAVVAYGLYGGDGTFYSFGQSAPLGFPADNKDFHTLAVQVNAETFNVLVDGQTVAENVPLEFHGGRIGLVTVKSKTIFDNLQADVWAPVAAQPTTPPADTSAPPPATEVPAAPGVPGASAAPIADLGPLFFNEVFSDAATQERWIPFSGSWVFEPGAYVQSNAEGYDFSAGYTEPFDTYVFRVQFQHRQGVGGGVLFNMPQPDRRNGAHLVRYMDEQSVAWGYFDDTGAFVGVGGTTVSNPGTAPHVMDVLNNGSTFSVWLDGAQIASEIPLTSAGKHIGLTSSQSVVAFQRVEVYGLPGAEPPPAELGEIDIVSGEWERVNGVTTQHNNAATDFIAGTGVIGTTYRVSVDITLPTDETLADAGGGLIIHMNGRDDPALGYLVRFGNGGRLVMWGTYDAQGVFQGQGGAPLELEAGAQHTLTLQVRETSMDIIVDDTTIATGIPAEKDSGWIGLVSFRGPVSFSNFQLALGS